MSDAVLLETLFARPKLFSYRALVFGLALAFAMLDGCDNVLLGIAAPALGTALHLTRASMASAFTGTLIGLALGALGLGALGDRIGRRPVTLACVGLIGVFTSLLPLSPGLPILVAFRFLTGLGIGGLLPNICALVSELAPQRLRQAAVLFVSGAIAFGGMLAGLIASSLMPAFGWQSVFYVMGTLTVLILLAGIFLLPESISFLLTVRRAGPEQITRALRRLAPEVNVDPAILKAPAKAGAGSIWRLFEGPLALVTIAVWLSYVVILVTMYLLLQWTPTLAKDLGFTLNFGILALSLFNLGGTLGSVAFGLLAERWRIQLITPVTLLLVAPATAALALSTAHPILFLVSAFCSGWVVMGALGTINALAASAYPTEIRATGIGWASGVGRLGAIASPLVVGWLLQVGWDARAILLLPVAPALVTALVTGSISLRGRRDWRAVTREAQR